MSSQQVEPFVLCVNAMVAHFVAAHRATQANQRVKCKVKVIKYIVFGTTVPRTPASEPPIVFCALRETPSVVEVVVSPALVRIKHVIRAKIARDWIFPDDGMISWFPHTFIDTL